jgi:ankyrin repeat protein
MVRLLFVMFVSFADVAGAIAQPCPEANTQAGAWKGTPLHEAIRRNDLGAARRLISPTTVNERDSFGNTPLVTALTPTASLEPAGALNADRARALIQAENKTRQAIVSSLLDEGAAVNDRGASGITPLMQLAGWGYSPSVDRRLMEQFVRLGADVNARNDVGATALMLAASRGKIDLVKLLLSKGANPDKADSAAGYTARDYAKRDARA